MISRPISWVNTAFPFAAGYIMLGGEVDARLVIGTLFFLTAYNLLMYGVNDVFDYGSDIKNARKGGVEGAITPKKYHPMILWSSGLLTLPFAIYLLITGSLASNLTLIAVLFFVVAYSLKWLRFKEIPVLDSVSSSIHFVGPLVYSYMFFTASVEAWLIALAFFLWGMASHAFGAVQDIVPDRKAGISSIATVFGAAWTVRLAFVLYILAAGIVASLGGVGWVVAGAGLLYAINVAPFLSVSDTSSAQASAGWRRFLWLNYLTGAVVTICLITLFNVHLA